MKGLKSAIKWIVAIVLICAIAVGLASINGLKVSRTVITVNGSEITEAEYKFYVEMAKQEVLSEQGITDEAAAKTFLAEGKVGEQSAADHIREKALDQIVRIEVAVVQAKEAGVSLTDEERTSARSTAGMEEYIEMYGVDEEVYADVMEKTYIVDKYYTHMTTNSPDMFSVPDEEVLAEVNESYALVQHVLVSNGSTTNADGTTTVDETAAAEAKTKAEEVLAKAVGGEDFSSLITTYGEDPGMESNPEGYLITEDGYTLDQQSQMVAEFTQGAFAVKAGEVNPELVESDYGWHIIKRCEITANHADYATLQESAKNALMSEKFDAYLDSLKAGMKIEKKDDVLKNIKVEY